MLVAAILGHFIKAITPEIADATAAVVVSVIILIALLPLLSGMYRTSCKLNELRREELAERIMAMNSVEPQQLQDYEVANASFA